MPPCASPESDNPLDEHAVLQASGANRRSRRRLHRVRTAHAHRRWGTHGRSGPKSSSSRERGHCTADRSNFDVGRPRTVACALVDFRYRMYRCQAAQQHCVSSIETLPNLFRSSSIHRPVVHSLEARWPLRRRLRFESPSFTGARAHCTRLWPCGGQGVRLGWRRTRLGRPHEQKRSIRPSRQSGRHINRVCRVRVRHARTRTSGGSDLARPPSAHSATPWCSVLLIFAQHSRPLRFTWQVLRGARV